MARRDRSDGTHVALGHFGLVGKVIGGAKFAGRLPLLILMFTRHARKAKSLPLVKLRKSFWTRAALRRIGEADRGRVASGAARHACRDARRGGVGAEAARVAILAAHAFHETRRIAPPSCGAFFARHACAGGKRVDVRVSARGACRAPGAVLQGLGIAKRSSRTGCALEAGLAVLVSGTAATLHAVVPLGAIYASVCISCARVAADCALHTFAASRFLKLSGVTPIARRGAGLERRFAVKALDFQPGLEIVRAGFAQLAIFRVVVKVGVRGNNDKISPRGAGPA